MDTKEKVRNFIIENFMFGREDATLNDEDPFIDEGIIDSTGFLEIIGFIQDEFSFEVSDKELIPDNFDSVNKLVAYIGRKVQTTS